MDFVLSFRLGESIIFSTGEEERDEHALGLGINAHLKGVQK
jgi:hypothetical protein